MFPDLIAIAVPFFFLLIFVELIYGNIKKQKLYRLNDTLTNLSCGIGQTVLGLWLKFYFVFLMIFFYKYRLFSIPNTWYYGILLFLGIDFCYYWFHRLSHEINAIWAAHVVHHQSEEYNLSVALRQSWFQTLFSSSFYIPLPFLGFDPLLIAFIISINTLYQFWIHTKTINKLPRWIEFIFNTPSHHRVHHGTNPIYIDRNHAGSLIIWDRMFGTFQEEEEEVVYGITTPLKSWSPVWANLHYWRDITKIAFLSQRMSDKILAYLKPPGWQPKELGGRQYAPPVNKSYQKYDTPVTKEMKVYLIVQYILIVAVTSYFMFFGKPVLAENVSQLTVIRTIYIAIFIILSISSIGFLLESKPFAKYIEWLRILCFGLIGVFFMEESYGLYALIITGALSLVSFVHYTTLVVTKRNSNLIET